MSFRKRNTVLSASPATQAQVQSRSQPQLAAGLRPSPLDGRPTTSTGTPSLDAILASQAGLALGSSLLIEEQGTTDFSGVLLRYYAAEGLVQGHHLHVLGFSDRWKYELPALSAKQETAADKQPAQADEKMKIAWRYGALGDRNVPSTGAKNGEGGSASPFCHTFDLTKRLASASIKGTMSSTPVSSPQMLLFDSTKAAPPFQIFIKSLRDKLQSSPPSSVHRVIVPSLLSPTLYTPEACQPQQVLQFMHSLRALLRQYSERLTAVITLPVSLFPRSSGMTRWMELLSDGVLELIPLPPKLGASPQTWSGKPQAREQEQSQGFLRVHSLPVFHEKGGGGTDSNRFREDLSFHLSGSKGLVIQPFALPPLDEDDHKEKSPASTVKDGIDF